MNNHSFHNTIDMESELEKCKNSLVYFAQNYLCDKDGNKIQWRDADIAFLKMIEDVRKQVGDDKLIEMMGDANGWVLKFKP